MASGLEILRDKRLANGGLSNVNCQGSEDDPHCLMEEFCCLYSEKLKAIDEQYPDSLEPKCQALTELVTDLSEQNYTLLKIVEELEKEAICRSEAFGHLVETTKVTMQQDTVRRGNESKRSAELECKVTELQDALHQNELNLTSCMVEIERLTRSLKEKKLETEEVHTVNGRMDELEHIIFGLQADLQQKHGLIQSLQIENEKLRVEALDKNRRFEDISDQLGVLKEELKEKNNLLEKFNMATYSPHDETRLELPIKSRVNESSKNCKWLEDMLEEKKSLLNKITEERNKLQHENQQMNHELLSYYKRVEELNKEIQSLRSILEQNQRELSHKKGKIQNELEEANYALNVDQQRLKEYEEQICFLETALFSMQQSPGDASKSIDLFRCRIKYLQEEIEKKDFEIIIHKNEEEKLKCELSQLRQYTNGIERQWKEKASVLGCEIERKNILLKKYERQLDSIKSLGVHDQKNYCKDASSKIYFKNRKNNDENDIDSLKFKLKDVQEALTAEIADKHDEIRRLKDDIKELEEKLLHSDKQTQFKDDIIKELRKEVKVGRAKESLAEMLGLKGTPRAAMKSRIDHLTLQLEEMRTHVLSLEERLAECNLPAVISLRSRLNNAEGSLLAMCNKMDYVRRYLENLKGDEELSMKCGLQALLSELRDDVEWNRQTRRNLSLDEGTSVIVISHRSHSLPDNSLHRSILKAKSDSAVAITNKQSSLYSQHSLESFQECREYIQVINDLISNFEDTRKKVSLLWNEFQDYTKGNGDNLLVTLNEVLFSFESSKEKIGDIIGNIETVEESKVNSFGYNLECLKENILEISDTLSKAYLFSDSSETNLIMEAGDARVKKILSTAINDSLSIIQTIENLKISSQVTDKDELTPFENKHSSVISLIKPLCDEKANFMKKLAALKKQQMEFSQKLIQKIKDFEEGFSSYNSSSEGLRKETKKLFAIILAKEKQIQKQFDEIDNLKMALSSSKYVEEASEEIDSLRKVVTNKDMQLVEKQDLIQNLRYLNHSLRTRQSHSYPSLTAHGDTSDNVLERSQELEGGLLNIKEKFSELTSDIMRSKDKMIKFEVETKCLVEALTKIHQDITNAKETFSKNPEQLSSLQVSFTEAEYKVEELLHALEVFICTEQRDFKEFTDSVSSYIEILLDIVEVIKKSIYNEKLLTKALKDENNELKEQLYKLQNPLTTTISQQTETSDNLLLEDVGTTDNLLVEDVCDYSKEELIQSLQEDLCRSNCYLEQIQEQYTTLKLEKAEMEEKNQKVMEELQAKICKLQASLQNQAPEANTVFQLSCIIEKQNQQICQNEIIEDSLRREIACKEEEIKTTKCDVKSMKNRLNTVNCMFGELQVKFEKAKDFIAELQEDHSETEMEIKSLKNKLNALDAMYSEVKKKLECANVHIVEYQEKLSEKEQECEEMKFQIEFQQRGLEKISQELREKSHQLNEIQLSEEMGSAVMNKQYQEMEDLKEKLVCWENLMLCLKKEMSERCEESNHWHTVSARQKENLSDLIEENQSLKIELETYRNELDGSKSELCEVTGELVKCRQHIYQLNKEKDDFENEKSILFDELENNKKELDELTEELGKSKNYIVQLNHEKGNLQNVIANLKELLAEKRSSSGLEYNLNHENFTKSIITEQEKFIEILVLKVCQMEKFLTDKEEIINLLETQLKTSTMLMMENLDEFEEDENLLCVTNSNAEGFPSVTREAAYKMKLWQSLEINRKLVSMVNSLQHLNHALLQERT
ncbi:putative leucine-rich repeat-containing protein DDB_G0290503 isoform X4 [Halyomorpha halys]|uniref:putative leucine-rich repeat-containing protein DDB_G0290503 isoform X4 n=1 Tax=Halyomorpha halys TaxID=286706 RepID=UPI0006D4D7A8|nr:interaptin-like isoform X4 [Halyomorpha halys]